MLCTEIVSDIQNNFCTQHVLPMFCKKKSFWQRFTCTTYLPHLVNVVKKRPLKLNTYNIKHTLSYSSLRHKDFVLKLASKPTINKKQDWIQLPWGSRHRRLLSFFCTLFFSKNITALLLNMVVNSNIPKRKTTRLLAVFGSVHGLRSGCDKHL